MVRSRRPLESCLTRNAGVRVEQPHAQADVLDRLQDLACKLISTQGTRNMIPVGKQFYDRQKYRLKS